MTKDMTPSTPTTSTRQFVTNFLIALAIIGGIWILYTIRGVINIFLMACFVSLLLSPFVGRMKKIGIPNVVAILMTFVAGILACTLFVIAIIPIFVDLGTNTKIYITKTIDLVQEEAKNDFPSIDHLPLGVGTMIKKEFNTSMIAGLILDNDRAKIISNSLVGNIDTWQNFAQKSLGQVGSIGASVASGVTTGLTFVSLFVLMTFFVILERKELLVWFFRILPPAISSYFHRRQNRISDAVHAWLRGQLLLALGMFLINLIGLFIAQKIGLPVTNIYSLSLIAGAMEFVPYAGPVISFLPAFFMVLVSPDVGLASIIGVITLYIIFQQIEGNIMAPWVMSRATSLSPLYILIFTLIGATIGGFVGVIIAIPLASIIHIFYRDWLHYRDSLVEE